jgi:hypothetical protein
MFTFSLDVSIILNILIIVCIPNEIFLEAILTAQNCTFLKGCSLSYAHIISLKKTPATNFDLL